MEKVYISETNQGIKRAVNEIISKIEEVNGSLLKSSKRVYIKPNGIDFKPHCHTSPEVLRAVIQYFQDEGAEKIFVMENSTQSNATRLVFEITGYNEVCEDTGAKPIYLDEEKTETFEFKGKPTVDEDHPRGYILKTFRLPKTIANIMENREEVTYINVPKLKTHSMAVVTLGIKNQWGLPQHSDRGKDHNYNLHSKLVDVYEYINPDMTLIDGTEGTIHGHYPPTAFEDELVKEFNILIGGQDTVAVDTVGARIFGFSVDEVPHLKIASERGLGEGNLDNIEVIGKDLTEYNTKYEWDLLQKFPDDVKIVKGKELLCREGCQNNPLATLQMLAYDHEEKFSGGFFIVMGKGHDENLVDQLKSEGYTKGLVAGFCAIDEVGQKLRDTFGKKNVHYSHNCNNLAETITALFKLSGVSPFDLVPISTIKALWILILSKLHGSKALTPSLF